jgi:AAA domain/MarR family
VNDLPTKKEALTSGPPAKDKIWGTTHFLEFLTFDELDKTPVSYRIPNLLTKKGNLIISAYRKTGKTSLILNVMAALAGQAKFLGEIDCEPVDGRVVYINLELPQSMLRKYAQEMEIDLTKDTIRIQDYLGASRMFMFNDEVWRVEYARRLAELRTKALVIDPLHPLIAMRGSDSNSNDEARVTMELLGEIALRAELDHLIIIDHTGHQDKSRGRGASGKEDWADVLWNVKKSEGDSPQRFLDAYGRGVVGHMKYAMDMQTKQLKVVPPEPEGEGKPTPEGILTALLDEAGEFLTVEEISLRTSFAPSTVSRYLNQMEQMGSVFRKDGHGRADGWGRKKAEVLSRTPSKGAGKRGRSFSAS